MLAGCLEFGGSHLCIGHIEPGSTEVHHFRRHHLDSGAGLDVLMATIAAAVSAVPGPHPARWAVALPGPFDYSAGIGGLHPARKFSAWAGQDVRALLAPILGSADITFVNDAAAFALGQDVSHPDIDRLIGLTLGSGIGSAFIEGGRPVTDGRVPPGGEVYAVDCGGMSLEARFGPAALARASGLSSFRELAELARTDATVAERLRADFMGLADALAPWLRSFAPEVIACGGGVCRAWDIFGPAFTDRLTLIVPGVHVSAVVDTERAAMWGAVAYAMSGVE